VSYLNIYPESVDFGRQIRVAIISADGASGRQAAYIRWDEVGDGLIPEKNWYLMTKNEAQGLMDRLWTCGIRPTEAAGSAGQLAAVQAHLEDMRKLAFGKLSNE
jgi:hypothetical protein